DAPFETIAVDDDLDTVTVLHLADRPAGERLGADMTDARPRRDAAEPGVGEHGDVLAEAEVLERGSDLVDLLHPRPHRSAADQHEDVAGLQALVAVTLDCLDRGVLAREDAGRADLAIDTVRIDHARIDRRALDDRPFRGEIAARERHCRGEA